MSYQNEQYFSDYNYVTPLVDFTLPIENKPSEDDLFVEAWLSNLPKRPIIGKPKRLKAPKIHAVKNSLAKCLVVVEKLQQTQNLLKENVATMTSDNWKKHTVEIGSLREQLTTIMTAFNNPEYVHAFKSVVERRGKKRAQKKRRKIELKLLRENKVLENKKAHETIDKWLDGMKESVERAKAEEDMKKDADCVLSEVTKKKSEGRKQLALISALDRLRGVREQMAVQRGQQVSTEDRVAFNIATLRLTGMWEKSMQTYAKEEQGLKIMLEQNATEEVKVSTFAKDKQIMQEWEHVLFGHNYIPGTAYWGLTSAERDLEAFIAIRKSWDTFLSKTQGTKIPIGWVLPEGSNSNWSAYLQP